MNSSSLSICVIVCITVLLHVHCVRADTSDDNNDQQTDGNHHAHRHRRHRHHHNSNNDSDNSGDDNPADFVAAYRATEATVQQEEEEGSGGAGRGTSSLESRLNSLEQDVRHLCLEDEEDIERRIRALGVTCKCPKTEAPVCGSDNVTYYNRCYLHCRAQQVKDPTLGGYHRYEITLKKFGRC